MRFLKSSRKAADVLVGIRWFKIAGEARIQAPPAGLRAQIASASANLYVMALVGRA